jgi:hypothetical protein
MALPMNATPVYTLTVPSTQKQFKYRPFLVKDEKALLIAQQSEEHVVMLDTVKSVIAACAKSDIDVDKLASFDIEYIFLQMRAMSVGEAVDLIFQCDVDHGVDNERAQSAVRVNLLEVKVENFEGHTNKISLFDDVGIMLKYPTINTLKRLEETNSNDVDQVFDVIVDCIDYIYNTDEVFPAKDQTRQELIEFLNNLTSDQFEKLQQFFYTMPQLRAYVKYTCPVCNKDHNKYMEGLASFCKFFLICLSHDTLYNFYKLNFALLQYHKYSLEDLDNMIPFEREIYVTMLSEFLEQEKLRLQQRQ